MPLHLPDSFYNFRLMGIDPGMNTTGISIYDISRPPGELPRVQHIHAATLFNHKLGLYNEYDPEVSDERTGKLLKLRYELSRWLSWHQPVAVGCEAPFYNSLMPMAYGSLLSLVNALQYATWEHNPNIPFIMVEPQLVKKSIGVAGQKGKEVVREGLSRVPELTSVMNPGLDVLDEHAIDAVVVTHCLMKYKLTHLW